MRLSEGEKNETYQTTLRAARGSLEQIKRSDEAAGKLGFIFLARKNCRVSGGRESAESPIARYREINCAGCRNSDNCKSDKTSENSCILASLYFSFSRRFGYGTHASKEWVSS